ncbi:MAG: phosphonate C-P lyase system protein PhnH, partial [Ktedonobacteraceae bacterium]|nr:phosphonate C-P lyase system protein PhnH [Ktedonobacteraceae bacterium]
PGKLNQLPYPAFLGEPPHYRANSTDIPLNFYALGALWTLLDREVSFVLAANGQWLDLATAAAQWLALRTGATVVEPSMADFAFFCASSSNGLLTALNVGTLLEPESSATAIYCVEQLVAESREQPEVRDDNSGHYVALTGPGIQAECVMRVVGLAEGEVALIQATRQNYPLGIDIYLVDTMGRCVALPRTTKVRLLQVVANPALNEG